MKPTTAFRKRLALPRLVRNARVIRVGNGKLSARLVALGWALLSIAFANLGLAQIIFAAPIPGLQLVELSPAGARLSGVLLLAGGVAGVALRLSVVPILLGTYWACFAVVAFADAWLRGLPSLTGWVPFAEVLVLTAACMTAGAPARIASMSDALNISFGASLILFGIIHLVHRDAIGAMIPAWIPLAQYWPWLTGAFTMLAGIAILCQLRASSFALAMAIIYLSWLPLVHVDRLLQSRGSHEEWTFALIAVALAGCAVMTAGHDMQGLQTDLQPPAD